MNLAEVISPYLCLGRFGMEQLVINKYWQTIRTDRADTVGPFHAQVYTASVSSLFYPFKSVSH